MIKLLLVSSNKSVGYRLVQQLETKGLSVHHSYRLASALEKIHTGEYRLVLITEDLGQVAVVEILEVIKTDRLSTLTLVLTDSATLIQTKLDYLSAGADELVGTAISWPEFWLRFKNLLTKERAWPRPARKLADLTHYYQEGLVEGPSKQIRLRRKESKILECLTKFQHRVVGRADLMRFVWSNPAEYPSSDTIDVYIRRLRLKLGESGGKIKTYRGFGYKWEPAAVK